MSNSMEQNLFGEPMVLWLDASSITSPVGQETCKQFMSVSRRFLACETFECARDFIQSTRMDYRIFIITSGSLGKPISEWSEDVRQVVMIYVYCRDKRRNEIWAKQMSKVEGLFVELKDLIEKLKIDLKKYRKCKFDHNLSFELVPSKILSLENIKDFDLITQEILLKSIIKMKSLPSDKAATIEFCLKEFCRDAEEISLLEDFRKNYKSQEAIWWLTRDFSLSKLLRVVLADLNLDFLFSLGFFLRDIEENLSKNRIRASMKVFRFQILTAEQLRSIESFRGKFILINEMFFVDLDRRDGLKKFVEFPLKKNLVRVLFEIEIDPTIDESKNLANIAPFTFSPNEKQVLLSAGSLFKIESIELEKKNKIFLVQLRSAKFETNFDEQKQSLSPKTLIEPMRKFDVAEKLLLRLISESTTDRFDFFHDLAVICFHKDDFQQSLEHFERALALKNSPRTLYSLACLYQKFSHKHRALESFEKAIELWKNDLPIEDQQVFTDAHRNMAVVYENDAFYSRAFQIYRKTLELEEKFQFNTGSTFNNLANIYLKLGYLELALENYKFALKSKWKFFRAPNSSIGTTLLNISSVYAADGDYFNASDYAKQALTVFSGILTQNHPLFVEIHNDLRQFQEKIDKESNV